MKTVIIGSGNVAYHMAKAFMSSGISVVQVFGRNEKALAEISKETNIPYSTNALEDADLYVIAVSDSAIAETSLLITKKSALVVHTSGSMPLDTLAGNYRKGTLYPMQTFSKAKALDYTEVPFFIHAEEKDDIKILENVAQKISKHVSIANDEKRKYIHLTAVVACNFVNHLYTKAKELADSQNIPFSYFFPLIEETTQKIMQIEPKAAQTGPAVRGDKRVIQLHEEIISDAELKEIYKVINFSIQKTHGVK